MPVEVRGTQQPDSVVVATRIEVEDDVARSRRPLAP